MALSHAPPVSIATAKVRISSCSIGRSRVPERILSQPTGRSMPITAVSGKTTHSTSVPSGRMMSLKPTPSRRGLERDVGVGPFILRHGQFDDAAGAAIERVRQALARRNVGAVEHLQWHVISPVDRWAGSNRA